MIYEYNVEETLGSGVVMKREGFIGILQVSIMDKVII